LLVIVESEGVADGDDFRAGEDNTKALTTKSDIAFVEDVQ